MAWFIEGGVGMYAVLGAGVLTGGLAGLALLISIVAWFFRPLRVVARIGGMLAVLACTLPMMVGVGASWYSRSQINEIIAQPDLDEGTRRTLAAAGYAQARLPTNFGGGFACCMLFPASLAVLVAFAIPGPPQDDDDY